MSDITPTAQHVVDAMRRASDLVVERNAVYKDNYKMVGRVMKALFPDGAPELRTEEDFNRWHLFELMIVKLTRYTIAYQTGGHADSLDDLMVYAAMVGALDVEAANPGPQVPKQSGALTGVGLLPDSQWRGRKATWLPAGDGIHDPADRWVVSNQDADNDIITRGDHVRIVHHRGAGPIYLVEQVHQEQGVLCHSMADGSVSWFNPAFVTSQDVPQAGDRD